MPDPTERPLATVFNDREAVGQILIQQTDLGGFVLCHCDEGTNENVETFSRAEDAIEISRYDDAGNYRRLKTAPNLRHGWRLNLADVDKLERAVDYFYPGRLAMLDAWNQNRLVTTSLRETLNRQSGMYRVAAKISDQQIDDVVGNLCKSGDGCLRTILWKRDGGGGVPSTKLAPQKFDPAYDQTGNNRRAVPLLCQEACSLLVNECRKAVKGETSE
jgi:sirohydrochlorin cobaltochelatase